jgi:uncharacterized repeat protein (TIGR03803 family)
MKSTVNLLCRGATLAIAGAAFSLLPPVAQAKGYKVVYAVQNQVGIQTASDLLLDKKGNLYGTAYAGANDNSGSVYMVAKDGTATVLHSFSGEDGEYPYAGLIADTSGNLYGTTTEGGQANQGTIFQLAPDGTETVLYSFQDGTDSSNPWKDLIADKSGNLYGTSSGVYGGTYGAVFKLAPNGTLTLLHTFTNGSDGAYPFSGLIFDKKGNLYGTAQNAGDFDCGSSGGCGTVFEISAKGTFKVLHAFDGGTDCNAPDDSLIEDKSGNLYGTTYYGGNTGYGCIFKVASGGSSETVLYSFKGTGDDGEYPLGQLVADSAGNFYGTTYYGGVNGDGTVFKLTPGGKETILHSFAGGSDGAYPYAGLTVGKKGELFGTTKYGGGDANCTYGYGTVFEIKE